MSALSGSLGLLAGYHTSDEEEEEAAAASDEAESGSNHPASTAGATVNYFEGGDSSSDADSDKEPVGKVQLPEVAPSSPITLVDCISETRLPSPKLSTTTESTQIQGQSGVFANPFREEQKAQLSLLEKHVQLTVQEKPTEICGRKICVAYRKDGRCRFGRSCRFAHDSDLQLSYNAGTPGSNAGEAPLLFSTQECSSGEVGMAFEDVQPVQGKRKPGLSQTLIPPKRSMKNYKVQVGKERPWDL